METSHFHKVPNEIAVIQLLDGKFIEIALHARLTVEDVLQILASHCSLSEVDKDYFGLAHVDDRHNYFWLDEQAILCDLRFSGEPPGKIHLTHSIRFFVDTVYALTNATTIELLFLEIHRQLYKGELLASGGAYAKAAALLMRVYDSDIPNEDTALSLLHCILPVPPPKRVFAYFNGSEAQCEEEIYSIYCAYRHMPRGDAMLSFLQLVSTWPRYGCRYYTVLDTDKNTCLLSVSLGGLAIYEDKDSIKPKSVYAWDSLDNLYYKDNEFMIEVRVIGTPKRANGNEVSLDTSILSEDDALAQAVLDPTTQVTLSRRPAARIYLQTYECMTPRLAKCIWKAAIDQHQFYLEQRQRNRPSVSDVEQQELSEQLNRLASKSSIASSLPSLSSIRSSSSIGGSSTGNGAGAMPAAKVADGSCSSLPSLKSGASQKTEEQRQKDLELYKALLIRRKELEEKLLAKMAELKSVCLREGEITGSMPPEIKAALLPGEDPPKLKRRIGTAFSIPEELINADKIDKLSLMETEVELHRKIVAAAEKLSKDKNMNKSVRKKRQKDLQAATLKLKGLEKGLSQMRLSSSKPDISSMGSADSTNSWAGANGAYLTRIGASKGAVSCPTTPHGSVPDLTTRDGEKSEYEDDDQIMRRAPSSTSWQPQQRCSASSSTSSGSLGYGTGGSVGCGAGVCSGMPPPGPRSTSRASRYSIRSNSAVANGDELDNPLTDAHTHIYENVGYRSTSYRSSYRMAHYPTLQDNEQIIRKRAQSAHSIAPHGYMNGSNGHCGGQSTSFNEEDERQVNDPRNLPARRIPTSISCSAGFSTASLDRRALRPQTISNGNIQPNGREVHRSPMPIPIHRESPMSSESSPKLTHQHQQLIMAHRVTTFPVQNTRVEQLGGGKPFSTSELPRFKPPSGRLGPFPSRLPQYPTGSGVRSSSVSSSRLPAQTDPHMEALLDYYKNQARKNQQQQQQHQQVPKTATIV